MLSEPSGIFGCPSVQLLDVSDLQYATLHSIPSAQWRRIVVTCGCDGCDGIQPIQLVDEQYVYVTLGILA